MSRKTKAGPPAHSATTSYIFDTLNRITTLTYPAHTNYTFSYDALSRRTQLTRPNGVNTNYAYDNLSRLTSILHQTGSRTLTTIDGATYVYDAAGNRTSKTDKRTNVTSTYSYDPLYELTQVQQATTTESYSYDAVGNRLSSLGVSPYSYNTSNELTSTPTATYTYDNNGNMLTKTDSTGTTQYNWDFENRLTSVVLPGSGGTVSFKYDPFGRRIQKSSSLSTTNYVYDGANLLEEVDGAGNALARYVQSPGIDQPLAEARGSTTSYYQQDGLGSVTSLSNSSAALANTYSYDSFGKPVASSGTVTNPFRYTGRDFDAESGLFYYRARYYDPGVGRFVGEGPIGLNSGDVNFYEYADNSPMNFFDRWGNQIVPAGDAASWQIAKTYLCNSAAACAVINELENTHDVFVLNISDDYGMDQAYGPWKAFWNPHTGLCVGNGPQSPAIQLLHELVHLAQLKQGKSFSTKDSPTREEEAVQATNPAAEQLGEPARLNYADAHGDPAFLFPIPVPGERATCPCK